MEEAVRFTLCRWQKVRWQRLLILLQLASVRLQLRPNLPELSRKAKCAQVTWTSVKAHKNRQSALDNYFYKHQSRSSDVVEKWRVTKYTRLLKISWKTTLKRNEVVLLISNRDAPVSPLKVSHFWGWISSDEWGIEFKTSLQNKRRGEKKKNPI